MKKSILAIAVVAASVAAPAAMAAPTVYGNVHLSINDRDTNENLDMSSNTSAFGLKGSEDLGDGMKAIYKLEWQVDIADGGANGAGGTTANLVKRDQFLGLKAGWGKVMFGTFSSNYKQKGGKVDSMYRSQLEGRGLIQTQSRLHNGRDFNRGRLTNAVSYTTPKMGGIELVVNTTLSNHEEETIGAGLRWSNKSMLVFVDWIDAQPGNVAAPPPPGFPDITSGDTESAIKVGGKFKAKAFQVGGQYEMAEDLTGFDYIHLNGSFNFNKNNSIEATLGSATHIDDSDRDTTSWVLAYNHKLSKMTNMYVGYADKSADVAANEDSVLTAGIRKKF